MTIRWAICSEPGCPEYVPRGQGRCDAHRRDADRRRGTAAERGYTSRGHKAFRLAVLARDPICTICGLAPSTVADHYPDSRRDLVDAGLNPDDPGRGRGLCGPCHSRATAMTPGQKGGWNKRD